jgi:YfiH family protein
MTMFIVPSIFDKKIISAAQSTRLGGVSNAPYHSLNLGKSTNDKPECVEENRNLFFSALGTDVGNIAMSGQVHGTEILLAERPVMEKGFDAIISNTKGLTIAVSIADCTPVLIYDTKNKSIAAIHAGWRGTAVNIVQKTLLKMKQEFNTKGSDCIAFIGACIGYNSFEVGNDVAHYFDNSVKRIDMASQKWFVDLKTANKQQLVQSGLKEENIEISNYCTVENNDLFFSHRYEKGLTGRMMATIKIV